MDLLMPLSCKGICFSIACQIQCLDGVCWVTEPQHRSPCGPACCCGAIQLSVKGAFKSTMLEGGKKKTVLFSQAWEPSPPLKTLVQPLWPFGNLPDGPLPNCVCAVCVYVQHSRAMEVWVCVFCSSVTPQLCTFLRGGCELLVSWGWVTRIW